MAMEFDDACLATEPGPRADMALRHLALSGARIRQEGQGAADLAARFPAGHRPRGVVALGRGARLLRSILEPSCPSPFVAWPFAGLPGWVGPLDLVIVMASEGSEPALVAATREAVRRGSAVVVVADPASTIAEAAASSSSLLVPTCTSDELAAVVEVLTVVHDLGLGPLVVPEQVAAVADHVAEECSPHRDLSSNPAKDLALHLAEAQPLLYGGTVLAARAGRRIAEALRRHSGRLALAADAAELEPVLSAVTERDPFAAPFDRPDLPRPVLVILDEGTEDVDARRGATELRSLAAAHEVRVVSITAIESDSPMDRYTSLLLTGLFGATWLGIGLGRL